jgi:hypothetical protein
MECQRCLTGKQAKYRVYTDIIDHCRPDVEQLESGNWLIGNR